MKTKRILKVVCGVIERDGRYLLVKRPRDVMYAKHWEFPGGKVEEGETLKEALQRELKEELDIYVEVKDALPPVEKDFPYLIIELLPFRCEITKGTIKLLEHLDLIWVAPKQELDLLLCDGDLVIYNNL
jgi:8-oxo-dGTP diphosphatase